MRVGIFSKKIVLGLGAGLVSNVLAKPLEQSNRQKEQPFSAVALSNCTNDIGEFCNRHKEKLYIVSKRALKSDICSNWPSKVFSPYVQISSDNLVNINDMYNKTGQRYYTFAFVNSVNKLPYWSEENVHDSSEYDKQINELRKNDGNIMISFGGADGKELATDIKNEEELQNAYQEIINKYNLTWMDLDIEGNTLKDTDANARRNKVMSKLKRDNKNLVLSYCLPADLKGLSLVGIQLLQDAISKGVSIDVVNAMAMHYGQDDTNISNNKMVDYVITTANKVREQIEGLQLKNTKVGITVVIGQNEQEIFTINDANKIIEWAKQVDWLRLLSFWTANRDNGDNKGKAKTNASSSGIEQSLYEFTNIFKNFTSNDTCNRVEGTRDSNMIYISLAIAAISLGVATVGYFVKRRKNIACIT